MPHVPTIAIVDDDAAIRDALDGLIQSLGYRCLSFASAEAFLAGADRRAIDCMIVDVQMPGLTGIELQDRLTADGDALSMVFLTSYDDDATRARAMKGGAHAFFGKTVDDEILIASLHAALGTMARR